MSGIVFYRTENRAALVEWYTETFDADVWLEQPGCTILAFEGFRFGFCDADHTETEGVITFVYDTTNAVDAMHDRLGTAAREDPHENDQYRIYQFFANDPDGRTVEVQSFLHETPE
ncbi:VOC family protein [Salarchaeum sp. JOR-1]|uniref:VOC family protein n=1 Tax=Salarchaeum sp. JOR-1 TaxID=2599399 RepID=UPI001198CA80|nr:VOC family protein [Salarchaeum sp. JOR-1]QDX39465.1 VOC family protein [Salarchaeum sp. JOR-1]